MVDVTEVRRRLVHTIEAVRRDTAARRVAVDRASAEYETFVSQVAAPVFKHFAQALRAQGLLFQLQTPAGVLRLTSERSADDFVEITLDVNRTPPAAVGQVSYRRGSRMQGTDQPIHADKPIDRLTEEDVLEFLLRAIVPFIER